MHEKYWCENEICIIFFDDFSRFLCSLKWEFPWRNLVRIIDAKQKLIVLPLLLLPSERFYLNKWPAVPICVLGWNYFYFCVRCDALFLKKRSIFLFYCPIVSEMGHFSREMEISFNRILSFKSQFLPRFYRVSQETLSPMVPRQLRFHERSLHITA